METIVQFIAPGDVFMAHGQRHIVRHARRVAGEFIQPYVILAGERDGGWLWEAEFTWGETIDIIDTIPGRASGS